MSRANGRPECPLCFANAAWREISIARIVAQPLSCIKCYWISGPIAEPIGNCGELCSSAFINIGSTAYMKLYARSRWGGSSLTGVFILAEVWSVGWMFSFFFFIFIIDIYICVQALQLCVVSCTIAVNDMATHCLPEVLPEESTRARKISNISENVNISMFCFSKCANLNHNMI